MTLTDTEKKRLIGELVRSMEGEPEDDKSRFSILFNAARDIVGKGIMTVSRKDELVLGRKMIAYQMRKEGYKLQTIGKHLGRHHASVYHMIKEMRDVFDYPHIYSKETEYWKRFQENIKRYENDGM
jgi:chromosomal replication initiation ATPase DnaA